jgi:hypothetical protein
VKKTQPLKSSTPCSEAVITGQPVERNLVLWQIVSDIPSVIGESDTVSEAEAEELIYIADSRLLPDIDQVREVLNQLEPGQASLHGWRTVHSSQPNTSTCPRVGLAIGYIATEVSQQNPEVRDRVSLVAVKYEGDWFEVEKESVKEYRAEEWSEPKISIKRERERRKSVELGMLPCHKEKGLSEQNHSTTFAYLNKAGPAGRLATSYGDLDLFISFLLRSQRRSSQPLPVKLSHHLH